MLFVQKLLRSTPVHKKYKNKLLKNFMHLKSLKSFRDIYENIQY